MGRTARYGGPCGLERSAIKADVAEVKDIHLLNAMGYIIKSKRTSGAHRITPESIWSGARLVL